MKHVSKRRSIFRNSSKKSTSCANFVYVAFWPILIFDGCSIKKPPSLHNYTLCGKGDFLSRCHLTCYSPAPRSGIGYLVHGRTRLPLVQKRLTGPNPAYAAGTGSKALSKVYCSV